MRALSQKNSESPHKNQVCSVFADLYIIYMTRKPTVTGWFFLCRDSDYFWDSMHGVFRLAGIQSNIIIASSVAEPKLFISGSDFAHNFGSGFGSSSSYSQILPLKIVLL